MTDTKPAFHAKDHAKLFEMRAVVQGRVDSLHWTPGSMKMSIGFTGLYITVKIKICIIIMRRTYLSSHIYQCSTQREVKKPLIFSVELQLHHFPWNHAGLFQIQIKAARYCEGPIVL